MLRNLIARACTSLALCLFPSLLLGAAAPDQAQPPVPAGIEADRPRAYVLTFGPGDAVWEKFGHNAIWVHDPVAGTDIAYNWGMFDFDAPDFYSRFARGDMRYWMEGHDAIRTIEYYASVDRSVFAQELNLSPAQVTALQSFLRWNALEANKYYRYDYYRDNCSTRLRDAIDRLLGGTVAGSLRGIPTGTTYRSHTRRLTQDDVAIFTALDLAMGHAIDTELSAWEESFLPIQLMQHLRRVHITDEVGTVLPLVASEQVIYRSTRMPVPDSPPEWRLRYLFAGLLIGGTLLGLGVLAARGRAAGRWGLVAIGGAWTALTGVLGATMALLWLLTDHYPTYANENVLQMNPLSLVLAVVLPLFLVRNRAVKTVQRVAWTVAGLAFMGWVLQAVPGLDQVNGEIVALCLPAHAGLAWAVWRVARSRAEALDEPRPAQADRPAGRAWPRAGTA